MYRIIDGRGTGKTSRLLLLAKENDGIVVCAWPNAMREKSHRYGITGVEFMSYEDFIKNIENKEIIVPNHTPNGIVENTTANLKGFFTDKPVFVDDLERLFNKICLSKFSGYTISIED